MNPQFTLALLLISSSVAIATVVSGQSFKFGSWEHCYEEDSDPALSVSSVYLQIVQSKSHKLGFQIYVNFTTNTTIDTGAIEVKLWHAESGDHIKFPLIDMCCNFLQPQSPCSEEGVPVDCPIEPGEHSAMTERLFTKEVSGEFEVELHLWETPSKEIMCIIIPFKIADTFLEKFQSERVAKQTILLL